jgi:hypothetical protein
MQRHDEAQAPVRAAGRSIEVVARASGEADHVSADLGDFRVDEIQGHIPVFTLEVVRGLEVDRQRAAALESLGEERLEEG